jgi:elongation factor P
MAMLEYNEVVERKYIIMDGAPYEVLSSHVFRKQQRKPVNATKLKNMITGKVTERSYHQSEKVEEAEIEKKELKYLYSNKGEYWFCDPKDPSSRFKVEEALMGPQIRFIKANSIVEAQYFDEKIISFRFPITVDLKVVEAPPGVRGDTVTGGSKVVKLETGATINVPLFIGEGELIKINTETGEYRERTQDRDK